MEAAAAFFPKAQWQRCIIHCYRNVFSHVPNIKVDEVARMLNAIHAQEDRTAAQAKVAEIVAKLKAMRLTSAAELVAQQADETLRLTASQAITGAAFAPIIP